MGAGKPAAAAASHGAGAHGHAAGGLLEASAANIGVMGHAEKHGMGHATTTAPAHAL